MEAVPRLSMISCDIKVSPANTEFAPVLKKYIRDHYHEDPESYFKEIKELEVLRQNAIKAPTDFTGCSILKKYFCQLHKLQSRFPMTDDGPACVPFLWTDIYSGVAYNITDIEYEEACILYNIGALHSKLGNMDARINADGMKIACTHFQCAAWAFQHLRDTYPQPKGSDMSHDLLTFFYNVMLAQAQECILEKSMLDSRKSSITAKVAAQVVDYYKCALGILVCGSPSTDVGTVRDIVGSKIFKSWKKSIEFKMSYYMSISHLFMGNQSEENEKWGERVSWYQSAFDHLTEAFKIAKGVDREEILDALTFTNDVIGGKYNSSKKENEFVYHEKVPAVNSLPEVKGASLVKGIPFNSTDPDVSGPDIFSRLVPMEAHETSSMYSEEKAKILRNVVSNIESKNEELMAYLSSLQLEKADIMTFQSEEKIPQELLEKCAAMSVQQNAITDMQNIISELITVSKDVGTALQAASILLAEDAQKELNHQEMFGKRAPSMIVTELKKECSKYEEANKKAAESNKTLESAVNVHISNMSKLLMPLEELAATLPSIKTVKTPENKKILEDFLALVDKVDEMRSQRSYLEQRLREALMNDDITKNLVTNKSGNLEKTFEEELKKHTEVLTYIEQNLAAQDNILCALTEANARYADTKKAIMEIRQRRDSIVKSHVSSFDAYEGVMTKVKKGLEFYQKLQGSANRLLTRVKSVTNVQDEERMQISGVNMKKTVKFPVVPSAHPTEAATAPKLKDYLPYMTKQGGIISVPQGLLNHQPSDTSTSLRQPASTMPIVPGHIVKLGPKDFEDGNEFQPMGDRPAPLGSEQTSAPVGCTPVLTNSVSQQWSNFAPAGSYQYPQVPTPPLNVYPAQTMTVTPSPAPYSSYKPQLPPRSSVTHQPTSLRVYQPQVVPSQNPQQPKFVPSVLSPTPYQPTQSQYQPGQMPYQPPFQGPVSSSAQYSQPQFHPTVSLSQVPQQPLPFTGTSINHSQVAPSPNIATSFVPPSSTAISGQHTLPNSADVSGQYQLPNSFQQFSSMTSFSNQHVGNVPYHPQAAQAPHPTQGHVTNSQPPVPSSTVMQSSSGAYGHLPFSQATSTGTYYPQADAPLPAMYNQNVSGVYGSKNQPGSGLIPPGTSPAAVSVPSMPTGAMQMPAVTTPMYTGTQMATAVTPMPLGAMQIPTGMMQMSTAVTHMHTAALSSAVASAGYNYATANQQPAMMQPTLTNANIPIFSQTAGGQSGMGQSKPVVQPMPQTTNKQSGMVPPAEFPYQQYQASQGQYPSVLNSQSMTVSPQHSTGTTLDPRTSNLSSAGLHSIPNISPNLPVGSNSGMNMTNAAYTQQQYYGQVTTTANSTNVVLNPAVQNVPSASYGPQVPISMGQDAAQNFAIPNQNLPAPIEPRQTVSPPLNTAVEQEGSKVGQERKASLTPEESQTETCSSRGSVTPPADEKVLNSVKDEIENVPKILRLEDIDPKSVMQPKDKEPVKDPLEDNSVRIKFVSEVEKYEKFVDGLVRKSLNGTMPLDQKWKELVDSQDKESRKFSISVARCYPLKNRYPDVMPYDSNRVQLVSAKDDYINASYLKDICPSSPVFVITQAPLPTTFVDFWLMVWEQQVETLICLLSDSELKNHVYFPKERGQAIPYGAFEASLQSCKERNGFVERMINLTHLKNRTSRVVVHLQFTQWPVGGIPQSPAPLLQFVSDVLSYQKQQRNLLRPVVVHCSAGTGRSGCFCLIMALVNEMNGGHGPRDVAQVATSVSPQRKFLIQDKDQLKFCYDTVLYYAQDLLMKRGILTSRASFENKLPASGNTTSSHHVRHPSEDFILGSGGLAKLQSGMEKMGLGPGSSSDNQSVATNDSEGGAEVTQNGDGDCTTDDPVEGYEPTTTSLQPHGPGSLQSEETDSNFSDQKLPVNATKSLTSLLDPSNFTLDGTPTRRKITKENFANSKGSLTNPSADNSDPLSQLDPLWTMKK